MLNDIIKMIPIHIMGRKYEVPQGLTILKAIEYAGYRLQRGCGCRGGVCGACVTMYRQKGDYRLKVGLACQTQVEPDMFLTQIPFVPANRALYSIRSVSPTDSEITALYPELMRCLQCNTCTKACPMGLEVMDYVAAAMRGDLELVLELSIECLMCGMCAVRCPAEISPFNIAMLARRMYGKYALPPSAALAQRLEEIKSGRYRAELEELKKADEASLAARFQELQASRGRSV